MPEAATKSIKVASIPGDGSRRIDYTDGETVGQVLNRAEIGLTEHSEVRLDGEVVTKDTKLEGDRLSLVVGKRTAGN